MVFHHPMNRRKFLVAGGALAGGNPKRSMNSKLVFGFCLMVVTALAQTPAAPAPLSPAILEKIDRMTPLFDGQTLNGWIQAPPYPLTFSGSEIVDVPALAKKLLSRSGAVATLLAGLIEERDQPAFAAF